MAAPSPRPAPAVRPRHLARGQPDRRRPAQRDRRRRAAARRRRRRAGLGQLAVARRATPPLRDSAVGPGRAAPGPHPGARGRPTGCWRSSSSSPGWSSSASSSPATCATRAAPRCRSPRRSAAWSCPPLLYLAGQPAAPARRLRGLGDPDRHRHRLRAGRPRGRSAPTCRPRCARSCSPSPSSTTCSRSRSSPLLHRRRCTLLPLLLAAAAARACSPCWCSAGSGPGGCCCRWPSPPGRWCTPPASTPPSPGCCSASPSRCAQARRRPGRRAWPSTSSTGSARSRPASRCPVFAFFAAGVTVGGLAGLGAVAGRPGRRSASSPGWSSASPSASSAPPGWSQRFTRAQLDDDLSWSDVLGLALLGGIGFTVSLLIGELAFGAGSDARRPRQDRRAARLGVRRRCSPPCCCGSATATTARSASRRSVDDDRDGVPDTCQTRRSRRAVRLA